MKGGNMNKAMYIRKIDALIPAAEAEALMLLSIWLYTSEKIKSLKSSYSIEKGVDGKPYKYCLFTKYFHKAMNRLAFEEGLRPKIN